MTRDEIMAMSNPELIAAIDEWEHDVIVETVGTDDGRWRAHIQYPAKSDGRLQWLYGDASTLSEAIRAALLAVGDAREREGGE